MTSKILILATCCAIATSVAHADVILLDENGDPIAAPAASATNLGASFTTAPNVPNLGVNFATTPSAPAPGASSATTPSTTNLGTKLATAPRLLTLDAINVEVGSVAPLDTTQGDAVPGTNRSTTPTLNELGWSNGFDVGVGFNPDPNNNSGITLQKLVLTLYNGTTPINGGSFSLSPTFAPFNFTTLDLAQARSSNSVFHFGLSAAQQTQFNAILTQPRSSEFFAGLSAELGCPAGAPVSCFPSTGLGPDTFIGFNANELPTANTLAAANEFAAVPGPVVGGGLPGFIFACLALWQRQRRRNTVA